MKKAVIFLVILISAAFAINPQEALDYEDIILASGRTEDTELALLAAEFEKFCKNDTKEVFWEDVQIVFRLDYEGSDIPPAYMLFFSNSIVLLKSRFYSEDLKLSGNRFFRYSLDNNKLELISIDSRMDASRWLSVSSYYMNKGQEIVSIDERRNSVVYNFTKKEILFSGFYFR